MGDQRLLVVDEDEPRLTVGAVARRLGIAPATLRTWNRRYGIGPSGHVPGRHRRYSLDDLARLQLMHQALLEGAKPGEAARYALSARERTSAVDWPLPRPDLLDVGPDALYRTVAGGLRSSVPPAPAVDPAHPVDEVPASEWVPPDWPPGAGPRARALGRAALALDAAAVRAVLAEAVAESGAAHAWADTAEPVLAAVATRWARTGRGVEIEHLVGESVRGVCGEVAADATPSGRPVLLAAMPGEHHTLALVVLATALAQRGVRCRSLGPDVPAAAVAEAVRRTDPGAVVLWSQTPSTADAAALGSLPRTSYRLFVGGPGWDGGELPERAERLTTLVAATATINGTINAGISAGISAAGGSG